LTGDTEVSEQNYYKPVGAGDGCGTSVVNVAAMQKRIAQLERELAHAHAAALGDDAKFQGAIGACAHFAQRAEQSELALAEARRDGYVSVPREPTEAMLEAIMNSPWIVECSTRCVGNEVITTRKEWRDQRYIIDGWQAMLDAALATQPHTTDEAH
jgi:hypothetical protein